MTTAEEVKTGESPVPAAASEKAVAVEEKSVKDEKTSDSLIEKPEKTSMDRDVALAQVETEKKKSTIKAWEDAEKSKVNNKAENQLATVSTTEIAKKAKIEAQLKEFEESMEKQKADYVEKMKNKLAVIHKQAEEKRAIVEANRALEILKAEESAAKFRVSGLVPKSGFACLGA